MQARHLVPFVIFLSAALALGSCDALYSFNLFKGLDPSKASPADLAKMSLDELNDNSRSDHWIDDVVSNPEALAAAQGNLGGIITNPESLPGDIQTAIEVWTMLELASSGADAVVAGVFQGVEQLAAASAAAQDPATADTATASFLAALFPGGFPGQEALTAYIVSMCASASMYEAYAATLVDADGNPTNAPPDPRVNPGELAQNALVCLLVSDLAIKDPATGDPVEGTTPEELAAALYTLMDDDADNDVSILFVVPDFSDPTTPLGLILGQAGLDLSTFISTGEGG